MKNDSASVDSLSVWIFYITLIKLVLNIINMVAAKFTANVLTSNAHN